jgi:hypothetical protein
MFCSSAGLENSHERNLSPAGTVNAHKKFQTQEYSMASNKKQQNKRGGEKSRPVGNYNPGGQAGKSVQGGGQRPADEPGGPFLGRSAGNPSPGSANPGQTGTPGGKGKQDAPQNQKR